MNTQKYHFAIVVLLLGVVLLPVTTASQSADRDLGIVRLRYANSLARPPADHHHWQVRALAWFPTSFSPRIVFSGKPICLSQCCGIFQISAHDGIGSAISEGQDGRRYR